MKLGEKLAKLRRENNLTQEQLAQILGVSRQAVSRWESDLAYPETEKLLRLGELYRCSMDYLLKDQSDTPVQEGASARLCLRNVYFERKSRCMVCGVPLWHINIGLGRTAKGIFALGLVSQGVVSFGLCAAGILSFGALSVGILSFGAIAAGILTAGAIALGAIAFGAISVGVLSVGAMSVGVYSIGALAVGQYGAVGDTVKLLTAPDQVCPTWLHWAEALFKWLTAG